MRSYSKILIYAAILALTISLAHAAKPEVSFSLSSTEVLLGDSVILTITVRGVKNPSTPHIPAINGFNTKFRGVRQESFSSFSLVIQGKQIKKESSGGGYNFDYELVPQRAGVLQVPSLAIVVDGRTYNMQKFSVKVLDRSQKSEDLFIKIVTDRTRVYLGEKLLREALDETIRSLEQASPTFWEDTDRGNQNIYYSPDTEFLPIFQGMFEEALRLKL